MIDYFEQLIPEEQEGITEVIQTLFRQTFLLERKFDRRLGRMQYTHEYRVCSKHFEFLKLYFAAAGITLNENVQMGLIYIQGETLWGEKLPRLATIYLLILKLIYDGFRFFEQPYRDDARGDQRKSRGIRRASDIAVSDGDPADGGAFEAVSGDRAVGCVGGIERIHKTCHLSEYSCGAVGRRYPGAASDIRRGR